jgi:adenylylsulfate kinase
MNGSGITFQVLELEKRMVDNLHHHSQKVTTQMKSKRHGHLPCVVWLTGLSGSGKSTIGNILEAKLFDLGCSTRLLDGDNVRLGLNKDLGFKPHERKENIRRVGEVANLFAESGMITITAFISPYQEDRSQARSVSKHKFIEVFVKARLDTCESRDPKGLYKKARAGLIQGFTGIDAPYEEPINPEIVVDTDIVTTADECANLIITELSKMGIVESTLGEISSLDKSRTIAIDFDGVIHAYSQGFQGLENAYDGPHEGALEAITDLHNLGYRLVIVSSRPAYIIRPWLEKYGMSHFFDEVTNVKRPAAFYIDDHAVEFKKGSGLSWPAALNKILGERI